ncbi:hypothetical protein DBR06_SOUSAS10010016, partial [Sousa chinensis]
PANAILNQFQPAATSYL